MMRRIATIAGAIALMAAPAPLHAQQPKPQQQPPKAQQPAPPPTFPHAVHEGLFPSCLGCHAGVPAGGAASPYPSPALCANCHDDATMPKVDWKPPVPRGPGLLAFSHPSHLGKAKDVACGTCHAGAGAAKFMNVGRAAPERCVSCHTHQASAHLADDNKCTTCHRPITAATGLSEQHISALPKPASHASAEFQSAHGKAARASNANCATCHARESCARCHVDANRNGVIRALGNDARIARLAAAKGPSYQTPADHLSADFGLGHASAARANTARCATCHARASCETCHTGDGTRPVLAKLADAREAGSRGVRIPEPKAAVHPPKFARSHGGVASSGQAQCAACHAQKFCTDCHAGELSSRRYHTVKFVSTHPAKAYGRDVECTACHNAETFCRSCHKQVGLAAKSGVRSTVYHNAQPFWLLQHGRAARQDLTNCTTCHQQSYCLQCHSDVGSRINPHGQDFNAAAMSKRNSQICLVCHLKNPLGGK